MNIKQPAFGDGSHWEIVDWDKLDSRLLGMIWKITQGKNYLDPTCRDFWIGAGRKKFSRSVFHFWEPDDQSAQVENFLTACEDIGIIVSGRWMAEIEPVLDAEYSPPTVMSRMLKAVGIGTSKLPRKKLLDLQYPDTYLSRNKSILRTAEKTLLSAAVTGPQLAAQYKAWLDGVESEVGIKPIIYTSKWMWIHTGFPAWESEYKLWDAQYPNNPDEQDRPLYVPYGHWPQEWAWQYSASAVLTGVTGFMDVSKANCTMEQWIENYGGATLPPEPPGENMIAHNPNDLSLRNAPRVAPETFIKLMPANTHIEGSEIVTAADGSKWLHTTVPQAGYCASWLLVYETDPTIDTATITVEHNGKTGSATIPLE
jgi:hypothetical protein